MHTFFVDLASHGGLLACVTDRKVVSSSAVDGRMGDGALLPAVERTVERAGWSWEDIAGVACVLGPGGFTSLRMAVALANTLSHELGVPAAGIHLSELFLARARTASGMQSDGVLWLHSTRAQEIFVRGGPWREPTHVTLDQLEDGDVQTACTAWCGELIPAHRMRVERMGMREASLQSAEDVLPAFLSQQSYVSHLLLPWYGREG